MNFDHLIALQDGLAREKSRFARDANPSRAVWIAQREREIKAEEAFLGLPAVDCSLSDDELLAELFAA